MEHRGSPEMHKEPARRRAAREAKCAPKWLRARIRGLGGTQWIETRGEGRGTGREPKDGAEERAEWNSTNVRWGAIAGRF